VRLIIVGLAAALLLIPAAPVSAAASGVHKMQATDFSGAEKKKAKKRKAPKVEYMRAVPAK
jgi:hypothetical protein